MYWQQTYGEKQRLARLQQGAPSTELSSIHSSKKNEGRIERKKFESDAPET